MLHESRRLTAQHGHAADARKRFALEHARLTDAEHAAARQGSPPAERSRGTPVPERHESRKCAGATRSLTRALEYSRVVVLCEDQYHIAKHGARGQLHIIYRGMECRSL